MNNLPSTAEFDSSPTIRTVLDQLQAEDLANNFEGLKRTVILMLIEGYNFNQIYLKLGVTKHSVYKIKEELKEDFAWLKDENKVQKFSDNNREPINLLFQNSATACGSLSLSRYMELYVYDYQIEAQSKQWQASKFQDTLYRIWEENQKSCTLAPREHLKTTSVIGYMLKKIHARTHPIEINYYHLNKEMAYEKFRKWQLAVESNPILEHAIKRKARAWKDDYAELADGSIIHAMSYQQGTVGKHPHIIILDDVIDKKVMYSSERNQKSIDRFYMDIYPMISKMSGEKRIIVIGTAQREDDLYHSLPDDFKLSIYKAIIDDEKQKVLAPDLFTYQQLAKIRSDISEKQGEKYWLKEYQNKPISAMGLIIQPDWIKTYHNHPPIESLDIYQGWDLSVGKDLEKGDWTVGMTIGVDRNDSDKIKVYVLEVFRARIDFGKRLNAIIEQAHKWNPKLIGVESNVFQYDTVQTLIDRTNLPIKAIKSITNKIESFGAELAPHFENGKVLLHVSQQTLRQELLALPGGKYDDQADALKIAIRVSGMDDDDPQLFII